MIEEKLREPHHIFAPGKEDGHESGEEESPFIGTGDDEESEDEEETHHGTYINGSAGECFLASIGRRMFAEILGIAFWYTLLAHGLAERRIFAEIKTAGSAFPIRNEQCHRLAFSVTPVGSIFEI